MRKKNKKYLGFGILLIIVVGFIFFIGTQQTAIFFRPSDTTYFCNIDTGTCEFHFESKNQSQLFENVESGSIQIYQQRTFIGARSSPDNYPNGLWLEISEADCSKIGGDYEVLEWEDRAPQRIAICYIDKILNSKIGNIIYEQDYPDFLITSFDRDEIFITPSEDMKLISQSNPISVKTDFKINLYSNNNLIPKTYNDFIKISTTPENNILENLVDNSTSSKDIINIISEDKTKEEVINIITASKIDENIKASLINQVDKSYITYIVWSILSIILILFVYIIYKVIKK